MEALGAYFSGFSLGGQAQHGDLPQRLTSNKLRAVLVDLSLQSEEVQDRSADLLREMLIAYRLQTLPAGVLSLIARAAGRPARRACKLLLDAHGPLDCGLHLAGIDALNSVLTTVSRDPLRYARTTALTLTISAPPSPYGAQTYSTFMAAAHTAFPHLEALCLPASPLATSQDLSDLAPLGASLTSITIPSQFVFELAGSRWRLHAFTALRSLTISGKWQLRGGPERLRHTMQQLDHLPLLQHLHLFDPWEQHPRLSAASHLPTLRCGACLTHLQCGLFLEDWDAAALDALSGGLPSPTSGLPSLVSLALTLGRPPVPHAAAVPGPVGVVSILAALAQRTALTALELRMVDVRERCGFDALSSMARLARLRLRFDRPCGDVAPLLGALAQLRALTHLALTAHHGALSRAALQHLAGLAGSLQHLDLDTQPGAAADVLGHVGMLAKLQTLRLPRLRPGQLATGDMMSLTALRGLEVLAVRDNQYGVGLLFVQHVASRLVGLRELMVEQERVLQLEGSDSEDCDMEGLSDSDVWRLLPLQPRLTRLVLAGLSNVGGPGYGALRHMGGLRLLEIHFGMIFGALLLGLLPLPPSLRSLRMYCRDAMASEEGPTGVAEALRSLHEAGKQQDCEVTLRDWGEFKFLDP